MALAGFSNLLATRCQFKQSKSCSYFQDFSMLFLLLDANETIVAGSFVNFVDANDVENDADLSFSGPDFRPNWFPLSVIGSYRRLSSLTLSEWEAFSHKNPVTSSRVRSNRSSSVSEKPP